MRKVALCLTLCGLGVGSAMAQAPTTAGQAITTVGTTIGTSVLSIVVPVGVLFALVGAIAYGFKWLRRLTGR